MEKIKLLIVDDSAFMRKSLSLMVKDDSNIEVIATARNGEEAVKLNNQLRPDVITMDIEMPVMDGLTALKIIMKERPTPVIMVSSLTTDGADATIKALEFGAVDFIPKGMSYVNLGIVDLKKDLINKIKIFVRQKSLHERIKQIRENSRAVLRKTYIGERLYAPKGISAVGLGISTGGPLSLQKVIPFLKADMNVPFFIVQHMPPNFTKSLAERLNSLSKVRVKEAENGEKVEKGCVYLAPGGRHMTIDKYNSSGKIVISDKPSDTLYKPCVDVMLDSLADVYGGRTLGVIMTGMGKDGLNGIKKIKSLQGLAIAQNEGSCVVYGMPKAIVDNNLADVVLPLDKIANQINEVLK